MPLLENQILEFDQRATWTAEFVFKEDQNGDGVKDPVDMTGWSAKMQIKSDVGAATTLLELTTANGRILLGADGSIKIKVEATVTNVPWRSAGFDLFLKDTQGNVTNFMNGKIEVTPAYTEGV